MGKRAAVVIGINKTGNLAVLNSAAAGAEAVAEWLRSEGYDVECLTDKSKPVEKQTVENAIAKFVTRPPRYSMLVVYFSGHGYWHARSDLWLLSGAPEITSEAINLDGAMDLARYSGIPNVVFISDACRSIPDSRAGAFMKGIDAFPNYPEITNTSKVDVFKATSEAHAAYEGDIEGEKQSIMTYALISAYKEPEPDMIREIMDGTDKVRVVPNRKLEDYLQNKINDILAGININLTQTIEAHVPSDDNVYIARVHSLARGLSVSGTRGAGGAAPPPPSAPEKTLLLTETLKAGVDSGALIADSVRRSDPEAASKLARRLPNSIVDHFESQTGFVVQGARVIEAVSTKGNRNAWAELLEQGDGGDREAVIRVWDAEPAVSVAVKLEDGRSAVFACLHGYIGHARFDDTGLSNISYVPSSNNWRHSEYDRKKSEIELMRAAIAIKVDANTFQIRSNEEAKLLADKIRYAKGMDPTLGLYAAHAFAQAGEDKSVLSVMEYMQGDLGTDLFDVRILALRRGRSPSGNHAVVPFCPLLTQTWNLLRPRGIELPGVLKDAIPSLCNSLWTTFNPGFADTLMQAIKEGVLK